MSKPDDNPLDPAHLSVANRVKYLAFAAVALPAVLVWSAYASARDAIDRAIQRQID